LESLELNILPDLYLELV